MDHDEVFDQRYQDEIECDGFVIMADKGKCATICLQSVNVDTISDMINGDSKMIQAGILADAKRRIMDIAMKDKAESKVEALKALFDGLR